MDFNPKSDLQGTCLKLIVDSNVCLAVWPASCQSASWTPSCLFIWSTTVRWHD